MTDHLADILARTRRENLRRRAHVEAMRPVRRTPEPDRGKQGVQALRRTDSSRPSVLAEIKFRSPSAGAIRPWRPGEGVRIARQYEAAGAAAVSVLADAPGFGGSPLLVRRVSRAVEVPTLFKGFVIDPVQVDLAYDVGASLVLLLVRALDPGALGEMVSRVRIVGLEPVVEAADAREVDLAVESGATIVGVNARDLRTFQVDMQIAHDCVARIPEDRVAVFMSGVRSDDDFRAVAQSRADAVLIGEGLMREEDPGARLAAWIASASPAKPNSRG